MRRALLSVSDKTDLVPFAATLAEFGVELISTAGTARTLSAAAPPGAPHPAPAGGPRFLGRRGKAAPPGVCRRDPGRRPAPCRGTGPSRDPADRPRRRQSLSI